MAQQTNPVASEQAETADGTEVDTSLAFIGCNIPSVIKSKLWTMAVNAPGGSRPLSWAINQVLEQHFNKEQNGQTK